MNPSVGILAPSGDTTGSVDLANIQMMLDQAGSAVVGSGNFVVNAPIRMGKYQSLIGRGFTTHIRQADSTKPVVVIQNAEYPTIRDVRLGYGLHGVEMINSKRVQLHNVVVYQCASHALYGHDRLWIITIVGGCLNCNHGDGIHIVGGPDGSNGNALAVHGVDISANDGYGIIWAANGLSISGSCIQDNKLGGLCLSAMTASAVAVSVTGSYFESGQVANVILEAANRWAVAAVSFSANTFGGPVKTMPHFLFRKTDGGAIRQIVIDRSNWLIDPARSFSGDVSALVA